MIFDENQPIYLQIADELINRISSGKLVAGEKLPSVRELAAALTVNPNTVQKACQELERLGLLVTQRGVGSFVTDKQDFLKQLRQQKADHLIQVFMNDMYNLGFTLEEIVNFIEREAKTHGKNIDPGERQ